MYRTSVMPPKSYPAVMASSIYLCRSQHSILLLRARRRSAMRICELIPMLCVNFTACSFISCVHEDIRRDGLEYVQVSRFARYQIEGDAMILAPCGDSLAWGNCLREGALCIPPGTKQSQKRPRDAENGRTHYPELWMDRQPTSRLCDRSSTEVF